MRRQPEWLMPPAKTAEKASGHTTVRNAQFRCDRRIVPLRADIHDGH